MIVLAFFLRPRHALAGWRRGGMVQSYLMGDYPIVRVKRTGEIMHVRAVSSYTEAWTRHVPWWRRKLSSRRLKRAARKNILIRNNTIHNTAGAGIRLAR